MSGRHRARLRFAAGLAVVLAAAAACGVEVSVVGEGDGGPVGSPDGSADGRSPDAPAPDGGDGNDASTPDGGTSVTKFGDASVIHPTSIDLLAAGGAVNVSVILQKDPGDPAKLTAAEIISSTTDVVVVPGVLDDTHRDFVVTALPTATPHRPPTTIDVTIGGTQAKLPLVVRIARHFRGEGEEVELTLPSSTSFEFLLWGAGGRSAGASGGGGGFARGQATLAGTFTVRVGAPGESTGGGDHGGGAGGNNAGGGGGYSAIFLSNAAGATSTATALIIAGGGGGGGMNMGVSGAGGGGREMAGQAGGGSNGGKSPTNAGGGQEGGPGATAGGQLTGGNGGANGGGGGGGGWFGGGGGDQGCGGAGGLSRASGAANASFMNATDSVPGNSGDARRQNAGSPGFGGAVLITPL